MGQASSQQQGEDAPENSYSTDRDFTAFFGASKDIPHPRIQHWSPKSKRKRDPSPDPPRIPSEPTDILVDNHAETPPRPTKRKRLEKTDEKLRKEKKEKKKKREEKKKKKQNEEETEEKEKGEKGQQKEVARQRKRKRDVVNAPPTDTPTIEVQVDNRVPSDFESALTPSTNLQVKFKSHATPAKKAAKTISQAQPHSDSTGFAREQSEQSSSEMDQTDAQTAVKRGHVSKSNKHLTGFFTPDEVQTIEYYKVNFCNTNSLSSETFNWMVQHSRRDKNGEFPVDSSVISKEDFWQSIYELLPRRDRRSVYRFMRRHFQASSQKPHSWTRAQEDELAELHTIHGPKWALIAKEIGRTHDDVVQRWKNKVELRDTMNTGPWSVAEINQLQDVLNFMRDKLATTEPDVGRDIYEMNERKISWGTVSNYVKNTRSRQQCADRWRKIKRIVMNARKEGMPDAVYDPRKQRKGKLLPTVQRRKPAPKSARYVTSDDDDDDDNDSDYGAATSFEEPAKQGDGIANTASSGSSDQVEAFTNARPGSSRLSPASNRAPLKEGESENEGNEARDEMIPSLDVSDSKDNGDKMDSDGGTEEAASTSHISNGQARYQMITNTGSHFTANDSHTFDHTRDQSPAVKSESEADNEGVTFHAVDREIKKEDEDGDDNNATHERDHDDEHKKRRRKKEKRKDKSKKKHKHRDKDRDRDKDKERDRDKTKKRKKKKSKKDRGDRSSRKHKCGHERERRQ